MVPVGEGRRVYYHSPLPPARSGIADYSRELIPALARLLPLSIVSHEYSFAQDLINQEFSPISGSEWERRVDPAQDINIYHLGNNSDFFVSILQRALTVAGLVVLHDASLMGLLTGRGLSFFPRFLDYELGKAARLWQTSRNRYELFEWQDFLIRNLGLLVDSSLGLIVHSQYTSRLIQRRYRPEFVHHIHHHIAEHFLTSQTPALMAKRTQDFLDLHQTTIKFATFGYLTPPKRIDWLVQAFSQALERGVDACLILAGEPHPATKIHRLIETVPEDRVHVTGYLAEDDMLSLMSQVDLQLNLRFPSVGESSGTLTRAMGVGTPCVVMDYEAFSDYPASFVTKVAASGDAVDDLCAVLERFFRDPDEFRAKAEAARDFVVREAQVGTSAQKYLAAIRRVEEGIGRRSNLIRDLAVELGSILPDRIELDGSEDLHAAVTITRMLSQDEGVRDLARAVNCDVLDCGWLGGVGRRRDENLRTVFVLSTSTESSPVDFHQRLSRLRMRRFDVVIAVGLDLTLFPEIPCPQRWVDDDAQDIHFYNGLAMRSRRSLSIAFADLDSHHAGFRPRSRHQFPMILYEVLS